MVIVVGNPCCVFAEYARKDPIINNGWEGREDALSLLVCILAVEEELSPHEAAGHRRAGALVFERTQLQYPHSLLTMKRLSEEEQRRLAAAREKARMRAMNIAFDQLRGKLKVDRGRKVPKVKTLRLAIQYIDDLRRTLHRNAQGERYDVRKAEVSAWVEQQQTINSATTSVCCFGSDDATVSSLFTSRISFSSKPLKRTQRIHW
ncbi:unnamed protein product [Toxocara canis]|uniref:BHLH domain-containing protein n=1 Tax=Toxocara canis TaxID=6265 RepID=A0A183U303_TOXCA|nr:unnamed protein product [Toxocara canis]